MKKINKILILVIPAFTFLTLSCGCTKKSKVDYDLNLNETLRWNVSTEPPSLDWLVSTDTTSARIVDTLMEGLVRYGFKNEEVTLEPALATSWESSKDFKIWKFNLRAGVTWTDGVPFTAQHILDGWERLLNPKTGSEYANFLFNVKNSKKYFEGKTNDFKDVGIKISDSGQIIVELETSQSFFPVLLAHHSTFPIRKDVIEKHGAQWTEPANMVSLGAFKLKIWEHDKALVLERNDNYFGEKAKLKYILGRIVHESSTALNMFKKGELDAIDDIPTVELEKLKITSEYNKVPFLAFNFFAFNVKKPPFDNTKVRRAFNMAIDRDEINKILMGDKIPAFNVVPPGLVGHKYDIGARFNVKLANTLLDEVGFKDRTKLPLIKISFNTNENIQRIAENIQAQIKRNIGVAVQLENEEWKTYLKTLQSHNFQIYRMSWVADFPDADTFLNIFITGGGNNHSQWSHKRFDELLRLGVSEPDKTKRSQIYYEAQKILNEDEVPVIPLYYSSNQYLVNKRIKNYPNNRMYRFYANETEIVK